MKARIVIHPILFGLYPVLFAYAHNFDFALPAGEIVMLLASSGCCAAMLWGALSLAAGDSRKAAIGVSVFIVMFFSYGHLMNLIAMPLEGYHDKKIALCAFIPRSTPTFAPFGACNSRMAEPSICSRHDEIADAD